MTIRRTAFAWILTVGLVPAFLMPAGAAAQMVCGKRADIVKRLASGYQERQSAAGIASNGNLVEVFASRAGGWTIVFTRPGGMTCLMAVGENWNTVKEPFKEQGNGT